MSSYAQPMIQADFYQDLMKAINDEYQAICYYEQLAEMAPNTSIKKQILEIRDDEIRHYQMFSNLYCSLTGMEPMVHPFQPGAPNFQAGILASFKDEQEAVDFYHTIARLCHQPAIQEMFLSAAADEQNHAVWFLYFMIVCGK